jgi:hypothetical protein
VYPSCPGLVLFRGGGAVCCDKRNTGCCFNINKFSSTKTGRYEHVGKLLALALKIMPKDFICTNNQNFQCGGV